MPAREYIIRTRLDRVVTLPTEERALGVPRCCWRATAGKTLDGIDIGHADLIDHPPRIRSDRFEVAPLGFCVERAEGERGLAGAGNAGEHHEGVTRQFHVDVA
ncbi:hypothetical protein GCM10025880_06990 [Methylorubrum aminovorans]|nr:hypothetical protein GCM10025880_06990 [Methylorubrum aminovorans]